MPGLFFSQPDKDFYTLAKQSDNAASDIDLMVIGEDLVYADFFKLFEKTELKLGRKINPTFYSPAEWMVFFFQLFGLLED